jgi:predicted dehydrogenase
VNRRTAVLAGLGGQGKKWADLCRNHESVEIVGFADPSEPSRERARTEWGVPADRLFDSVPRALERTSPDFVLDITPPAVHREVALASFAAGLPILQEKPMSDRFPDAREMVEAGLRAGCIHMVSQQQRFARQPRATRRLLEQGRIGRPGQLDISFFVAWADKPGTHYVTKPWMFLLDMGCHHFDAMRYLLQADPLDARVVSWNLPWGWHVGDASHVALFDFPDGVRAVQRAVGCSNGKATPWSGDWRIEGPLGAVTWEGGRVFVSRQHRTENPRREEIDLDTGAGLEGQAAVLEEFLAALRDDREPECSAGDNLVTMAMTFAAVESAKTGQAVPLSRITGDRPGSDP